MMNSRKMTLLGAVAALILLLPGSSGWSQNSLQNGMKVPPSTRGQDYLVREVHHELVMLPYYGVFDNLAYKVEGNTVTLLGQVTRPTLKSDAEAAVKTIEGVESVNNQIEVLPPSPTDDNIRLAEYRAIYGQAPLDRYALQAIPPIHIIVKNGHVTLTGVVANDMDKNTAVIRAKTVPGVFSVDDQLKTGA
jgi:hyperosmotically inducible protein